MTRADVSGLVGALRRWLPDSALRSPQSVDPLSWFTRPFLPVTFAIAIGLAGLVAAVNGTLEGLPIAFQLLATLCFVLGCLSIHRRPGPRMTPFLARDAMVPLALAFLGVVVSGIGVGPTLTDLTRWWAPLGFGVVLAALAPFASALMLAIYGLLGTAVCVVTALLTIDFTPWPLVTGIMIAAVVPLQATFVVVVFSSFVVDRVVRWRALPIQGSLAPNPALSFAGWKANSDELKLLSDRVMPFIERIADEGFVSVKDRTLAGELATEVRDALIKTVDKTWLDALATDQHLRVIDPDNRAGRITLAQRGAIRSLLLAVLDSAGLVPDTLTIELRDGDDGDVAVALSMRLDLPEGERLMMIAPYYLTLQATVDDLVWDDQDLLSMRFRITAPGKDER